jgi:transcriptional regulator with XRE-family HTH domain
MQTQELQTKIGKELKRLRLVNNWTQDQVAEQLHICRNAYGDIESGKTDIHLSRLAQMAHFFGVEIGDLVGGAEKTVFHLTGTQNTQFHSSLRNEYHVHSAEEKLLQHELEKAQLTIEHLRQELTDKQKLIDLLESVIKKPL